MTEPQDDLWRDVSVVLKHIRFIVALLAIALLVAVATGLAANTESRATSEAEIEIRAGTPLLGGTETVLTLDALADLAESDEVAEAAAKRLGMDSQTFADSIEVSAVEKDPRDRDSMDRLSMRAAGSSPEQARKMAAAAMDAFVKAAEQLKSDPLGLESLQNQLASAQERLQEFDQGPLFALAQVQADLGDQRKLLTSLKTEVSTIDRALEVLETDGSRSLGELLVAVAGALNGPQGGGGIEQASTVEELRRGLELRREFVQGLIEETQLEVDDLAEREQELSRLTADQTAILSLYSTAARNLEAADLAAEQTEIEITITASGVNSSDGANWPARLGAAAAFALVAGVAGAFVLEFVTPYWQRWRHRSAKTSQPEEA